MGSTDIIGKKAIAFLITIIILAIPSVPKERIQTILLLSISYIFAQTVVDVRFSSRR